MVLLFGETLRCLRTQKGLSQQQFADLLHVERASVTNWEADRRVPSIDMLFRIAEVLDVDATTLLAASSGRSEIPNVLLLDDESIIVDGAIPILRELMPNANVIGFTKSLEAMAFFRERRIRHAADPVLYIPPGFAVANKVDAFHVPLPRFPV